jgi:hypothetical protein
MLKHSVFLFVIIIFFSCNNEGYYNKDFYERISNIKIPKSAHVIESIDNGEFVTTTVFIVDSITLKDFIHSYSFATSPLMPRLFGNSYLIKNKLDIPDSNNLYYKAGTKGKNSWLYIIDLKQKKLWAEVQYPDWSGN